MTLEYLETIFVLSQVAINPLLITPLIFENIANSGTGVVELGMAFLDPATIFEKTGTTLGLFVNEIWNWILYNILSPIIIIVGLVLFIALQIGLLYVYYRLVKEVVMRLIALWGSVSQNETFKGLKSKLDVIIKG